MKILVISPYVPHPKAGHGTGVFLYGLLAHLARVHDITLLTFVDDTEQLLAAELQGERFRIIGVPRAKGLRGSLPRRILLIAQRLLQMVGSILRWEPYYVSKYRNRQMSREVEAVTRAEQFDIVQLEFAFMGQYAPACRSGALVLHEHDVSYRPAYRRYRQAGSLPQRAVAFVEWCRWYRYETRLVRACHHVLTVTEQDQRLLEWLTGLTKISYLPRGMEMPAILPAFGGREPESILFIGTFQHHPNADAAAWMVTDIFPRIAQHHPRAILHVVGADPPAFFREQASRWPGIRVHGFVPEVDRFLDTCRVFLAPLRFGGGVKIKVLHAMSHGIPVVTTKIGIEGIEGYEPGMAKVGGTADELARHVRSLLEDQPQAEAMAAAARAMVERTFSWNALQERVEDIYHRASSPPHHPTVKLSGEEHRT